DHRQSEHEVLGWALAQQGELIFLHERIRNVCNVDPHNGYVPAVFQQGEVEYESIGSVFILQYDSFLTTPLMTPHVYKRGFNGTWSLPRYRCYYLLKSRTGHAVSQRRIDEIFDLISMSRA